MFDQVTSKLKAAERDQAHEPFLLERTQGRLDSLKNWMKESNPFDYSAAPKQFVGNNEDEPDTPLPLSSPNHLPISLLVSMTLSIARLDDNSSRHVCAQHLMASCPGFARVASVVYQKLSESWPATAGTDWSTEIADRKFSAAFEKELDQAAVRVIPWFAVADWERPGAGKHRIGPHAWVMVDPPRKNRQAIRDLPAVHRDIIDAETVTATLRLNNPAAPWKLSDCQTLAQLLFFLTSRSVLPNELLPASLLQPKSWTAGAKAAYATLDILVPAHQYVIWVAVITARSCPKLTVLEVRTDEADQALFANATKRLGSGIALGEWLQSLPFKISSREKQTKGRTEMNSTMQGIIMYYLTSVVTTSELVAAGATADWNKSNKWTDKFGESTNVFCLVPAQTTQRLPFIGSKGIKPLLLFRIGLVSSSALTSLPWSPKSSTWDFLSFAELEAKLMVAKTTIASDGFQAIVAQIWGQPFYNALVSTGRLQLT